MKHSSFLYMLSLVLASAVCSCSETDTADDIVVAREFTGISAGIASSDVGGSRAAVEKEPLYIGRQDFKGSDEIVMTSFHRTENKVDDYSYTDVIWVKADGDGGWTRSAYDTNGKIYWSDSENEHTIAGFSIPQNMPADRWVKSYDGYAGQLHLSGETGKVVYDTRDSFVDDDLLLTYDTSIRPDATGIATIFFRHALSCLTIDVNIQGFSSTPGMGLEEKDNASRVKSLVVRDQPYKYIWHEDAAGVTVSDEATSVADIVAWTNNPDGEGTGSSRRFYFHTLEVPGTRTQMVFDFEVSYPDPLNPANTLTNTYRATADNIEFVAGKRTTIKITLDHEKEKITVGAVYEDWIFIETPDAGNLAKNSTYLESTDMSGIRLHTDVGLTADDATWLYISSDDSSVLDIYGNDGSEENPYIISTAEQLLAFAGEVNTGAMDFSGRFVRLDASLYMQPTITSTSVDWIGIGSVTHPFKGSFEGGLRTISYLKGSSLFGYVGEG
ncbi:MAG: fimbrillin family protein, partial [Prevotella sp.]